MPSPPGPRTGSLSLPPLPCMGAVLGPERSWAPGEAEERVGSEERVILSQPLLVVTDTRSIMWEIPGPERYVLCPRSHSWPVMEPESKPRAGCLCRPHSFTFFLYYIFKNQNFFKKETNLRETPVAPPTP